MLLCRLMSMYINMRVNNAVLYIVAFFNYTKAFSLFQLTALTNTGNKNCVKFATLWSALFNSLRVFMTNNESNPFR